MCSDRERELNLREISDLGNDISQLKDSTDSLRVDLAVEHELVVMLLAGVSTEGLAAALRGRAHAILLLSNSPRQRDMAVEEYRLKPGIANGLYRLADELDNETGKT